ncbi:MAG: hypothetical protein JXR94_02320 [Candidatus Hydrogenedentes bacterium]|nr:hypothetical protein [Candidatus Hydrogenedentota bacterium]
MLNRAWIVSAAILICIAPAWAADTLDTVKEQIIARWDSAQAVSCRVGLELQMNVNGMALPGRGTGTLDYRRKDDTTCSRMDVAGALTVPMGDSTADLPQNVTAVFDGDQLHLQTVVLRMPVVMKYDASEEDDRKKSPAQLLFGGLEDAGELTLLPDASVNGAAAYALQVKFDEPDADGILPVAVLQLFFDKATGFPLRVQGFADGGAPVGALTFTDFKTDAEFPAGRFQYIAPEGAQFVDFSEAESALLPPMLR